MTQLVHNADHVPLVSTLPVQSAQQVSSTRLLCTSGIGDLLTWHMDQNLLVPSWTDISPD